MVQPDDQSDRGFFLSHIHLYLSEELSAENGLRFRRILEDPNYMAQFEAFGQKKGILQLRLQGISLNEEERTALQHKIADTNTDRSFEKARISEIEHSEKSIDFLRRASFLLIGAGLLWGIYHLLAPKVDKNHFDPLNALSWEALAMEEDQDGERLYFPSSDSVEISKYLAESRDLHFTPGILSPEPTAWIPVGGSVFDYDIRKIAVVQYKNPEDQASLFYFTLPGQLSKLPASTKSIQGRLRYQPYASDQLNIIAWQKNKDTLALLMGRVSIPNLAKIAANGSG